jgi:hypothetical protein
LVTVATATTPNRQSLIRQGQRLEYFTIVYYIAGSASLIGFGLDSAIEVASGAALTVAARSRPHQVQA